MYAIIRSTHPLYCCDQRLEYTNNYKYLGYIINECLSEDKCVEALTSAVSRSFGRIVNMFKSLKNMGIKTYETLFGSYVQPIMNYAAGVWGFGEQTQAQVLQNRVQHYYLGVNCFSPVAATSLEFDWLDAKMQRWVELVRYLNRVKSMSDDRWPVKVLRWDSSLKATGWATEVEHILNYADMSVNVLDDCEVDLDALKTRLLKMNRIKWRLEAADKTKLRTFMEVYDENSPRNIVEANLPRSQRSLVSKLKVGVLPLAIEVGRWKDTPLEKRLCHACGERLLENEYHFLIFCDKYTATRTELFNELEMRGIYPKGSEDEIVRTLLSKDALKISARYIERMFHERKAAVFKQDVGVDSDDESDDESDI